MCKTETELIINVFGCLSYLARELQRFDTEMHLHTRAAMVFQVFVGTSAVVWHSGDKQLSELGLEAWILNLWAS